MRSFLGAREVSSATRFRVRITICIFFYWRHLASTKFGNDYFDFVIVMAARMDASHPKKASLSIIMQIICPEENKEKQ